MNNNGQQQQQQQTIIDMDLKQIEFIENILWSTTTMNIDNGDYLDSSIIQRHHHHQQQQHENNMDAYTNGHWPQITFLAELDQMEIIKVLHRIQTANVYYELRLLFQTCNRQRIKILLLAANRLKNYYYCCCGENPDHNHHHHPPPQQQQQQQQNGRRKTMIYRQQQKIQNEKSRRQQKSQNNNNNNNNFSSTFHQQQKIIHPLKDQYCAHCLIMIIIIHFFGQKDLLDSLH
ncbi:hypothetical protein HUG17_5596 [Dermatophagoides farinae]|uniref:Uncharacterized protein n=1 Tax=Dermatophagoides farinae TaxID=6954 RepID=A0A9D4P0K3_DERFA|nr:hypothetical protein HUG17_5596 [Dermatophagoides farinae]